MYRYSPRKPDIFIYLARLFLYDFLYKYFHDLNIDEFAFEFHHSESSHHFEFDRARRCLLKFENGLIAI